MKKNKIKKTITIDVDEIKKFLNVMFRFIGGFLIAILIIVISAQFLIPTALAIFELFMSLVKIYPTIDPNFKFIGGFFFLFIFFKIFHVLLNIILILFKVMLKGVEEGLELSRDHFGKKHKSRGKKKNATN